MQHCGPPGSNPRPVPTGIKTPNTKSKMAVASSLFRYCMRHPTRVLVIGLLLVLVIASRFLYSSVPEDQPIQELNLMAGNLAQQHSLKNIGRKQNRIPSENKLDTDSLLILPVENGEKIASTLNDSNDSQLKGKDTDLLQTSLPKSKGIKISLHEANDEKAENDLTLRKIPHDGILHKNSGQISPFEFEANVKEVAMKKANTEERALLIDDFNKSSKDTERNSEEANGNLAVNKGKKKKNRKKELKSGLSKQENNVLMTLAKVGQTSPLAKRFKRCVLSICQHSSLKLSFHIITDTLGKLTSENTFNEAGKVCKSGLNVTYYDADKVSKAVKPITKEIQVCD